MFYSLHLAVYIYGSNHEQRQKNASYRMDSAIAPERHSAAAERVDSSSVLVTVAKVSYQYTQQGVNCRAFYANDRGAQASRPSPNPPPAPCKSKSVMVPGPAKPRARTRQWAEGQASWLGHCIMF